MSSTIIHQEQHPLAGQTVTFTPAGGTEQHEFLVEDWWDHLTGKSWGLSDGNPACIGYALRAGAAGLPTDDEVIYGKVGHLGHLVHASELSTPTSDEPTVVRILVSPRRPEKTRQLVDQLLDQATERGITVEIHETGPDQLASEKIARARAIVETRHQFQGPACTCGDFASEHARHRTEHITTALAAALEGVGS